MGTDKEGGKDGGIEQKDAKDAKGEKREI